MMWGAKRTHRGIAAALALLGVALYAYLLPGHLASQFAAQLRVADLGIFASAGAMCTSDSSDPASPDTSCPICKGLASFHMAMAPPATAELPVPPHAAAILAVSREDVAGLALIKPRSRGPPLPA
jgi:hypothetical protein